MSHTTSIKAIKIQSIAALRAAVTELATSGVRCSLVENATPRAYFSDQQGMGQADFVIKLDAAQYDVGLYKQPDNTYEARTDFYGGSVESCIGGAAKSEEHREQAKMGKLFQMYGVHAAMEQARKKGLNVRRINQQDGTVKLELSGANL